MRVLVTGAAGQLGRELVRTAPAEFEVIAADRGMLDIGDAAAVGQATEQFSPQLIINAAAFTAVDRAESQPAEAQRINAQGPTLLAAAARQLGNCRLIQVSTDYVFDGAAARPYRPDDPPRPLGVYGQTKLAGEQAVQQTLGSMALVLRTSWIYGAQGGNFLRTMLRLMRERGAVRVVNDQMGCPTAATSVAESIWMLAARAEISGIHHWSDAGVASWYDFAVAIAEEAAQRGLVPPSVQVTPISTEDYPTPARRPRFSVLDTGVTAQALGRQPQHWRKWLKRVMDRVDE